MEPHDFIAPDKGHYSNLSLPAETIEDEEERSPVVGRN
jgi:hypothetical protein